MNQLWLIFIIIFCAVVLAVQGGYWFVTEKKRSHDAVNRRLILAKQNTNSRDVLETLRRERGVIGLDSRYFPQFNHLIVQTGARLDGRLLISLAFSASVVFFLIFGLAFGYGLVSLVLGIIFAGVSLLLVLLVIRQRRIARFSEQLPDAIDVIVRGVKSGYPFTIALGLVAREMSDPIGTEFGMTADEITFGSDVASALDNLHRRVGHEDLLYLTMAIKIQNETGGNLAEILSRLARLVRERTMLKLKVKAISAEGRLSAVFLSVFPFLIFAVVNAISPSYYGGVWNHPAIMPSVVVGLTLLAIGNFIIYRMVHFKV